MKQKADKKASTALLFFILETGHILTDTSRCKQKTVLQSFIILKTYQKRVITIFV